MFAITHLLVQHRVILYELVKIFIKEHINRLAYIIFVNIPVAIKA